MLDFFVVEIKNFVFYYNIEIGNSLIVAFYHLVCFGSLMNIFNLRWDNINTLHEHEIRIKNMMCLPWYRDKLIFQIFLPSNMQVRYDSKYQGYKTPLYPMIHLQ